MYLSWLNMSVFHAAIVAKRELSGFGVDRAHAFVILQNHRFLRWHFQRGVRRFGIDVTQEQFVILSQLYLRDGCIQGEPVNETFNNRSSVSRMVAGMERNRGIKREQDPVDGRGDGVCLKRGGRVHRERSARCSEISLSWIDLTGFSGK